MKWWWMQLARYALPQARGMVLILVCMLAGVGLSLLAPWPLKLIVDHVLIDKPLPAMAAWVARLPAGGSPAGLLLWLAAATVGLFLARRMVTVVQEYVHAGVGAFMVYDLASDLFDHLQRCSPLYHGKRRVGGPFAATTGRIAKFGQCGRWPARRGLLGGRGSVGHDFEAAHWFGLEPVARFEPVAKEHPLSLPLVGQRPAGKQPRGQGRQVRIHQVRGRRRPLAELLAMPHRA